MSLLLSYTAVPSHFPTPQSTVPVVETGCLSGACWIPRQLGTLLTHFANINRPNPLATQQGHVSDPIYLRLLLPSR